MRILAFVYEADYHCADCAEKRFPGITESSEGHEDSEGNEPGALFSDHEWWLNDIAEGADHAVLSCGTCAYIINEIQFTIHLS